MALMVRVLTLALGFEQLRRLLVLLLTHLLELPFLTDLAMADLTRFFEDCSGLIFYFLDLIELKDGRVPWWPLDRACGSFR